MKQEAELERFLRPTNGLTCLLFHIASPTSLPLRCSPMLLPLLLPLVLLPTPLHASPIAPHITRPGNTSTRRSSILPTVVIYFFPWRLPCYSTAAWLPLSLPSVLLQPCLSAPLVLCLWSPAAMVSTHTWSAPWTTDRRRGCFPGPSHPSPFHTAVFIAFSVFLFFCVPPKVQFSLVISAAKPERKSAMASPAEQEK